MKHAYAETPSGLIYYDVEGQGEPVICLHQTTWSSREFIKLMSFLSPNHQVIALDLLGYGMSDPAPEGWGRVEDWSASVVQFMDAIGIKKATLMGSHAGSKLAVEVAVSHPNRIKGIALYGCGIYDENTERKYDPNSPWSKEVQTTTHSERIALTRKLQQIKAEIPVSGLHFYNMFMDLIQKDPAADAEVIQNAFLACVRTYDKRTTFNSGTMSDFEYKLESRAKAVKCPAVLIVGSSDMIGAPICKAPDAVAKLIPGCSTARIEEAGNFGLSYAAASVSKEIIAFLNKV